MFRNYLAAALRNLARNRLYTAIIISGLGIGIAAALLIGLFVHDEFNYDQLPLHERTFLLRTEMNTDGLETGIVDRSPPYFAAMMKLDFPEIEAIARLAPTIRRASFRNGDVESNEQIYWADPNIFDVLRLPTIAGNPLTALQKPDSVVVTRKIALKYFGRDNVVGQTLEFNRQYPLTVTAILEDLPSNTHLNFDIVLSGRAAFSNLAEMDSHPQSFVVSCLTYLRLAPGSSGSELERAMPAFLARHHIPPLYTPGFHPAMLLTPLFSIHLSPGLDPVTKPHGHVESILALGAVGVLIMLIASINFVNLLTARSIQRATEVGIRKIAGATRRNLFVQFIGEAMICVSFATLLGMALAELLLPALNTLTGRTILFDWWRSETYIGLFFSFILFMALLAGAYPAFVLSAFRPAAVLKSSVLQIGGSMAVRRALVIVQFAVLIGLILATMVIYRQTEFALTRGMGLNKNQVYLIRSDCKDSFKDTISVLPGVGAAACSSQVALGFGELGGPVRLPDGASITVMRHPVDFGFFELYGLRPIAGRLFSRDRPGDALSAGQPMNVPVIVNEAAARQFKFANPGRAIGASIRVERYRNDTMPSEIIGVVPDFQMDSVHSEVPPTVYFVDESQSAFLSVKLSGHDTTDTLRNIDRLWTKAGAIGPINRMFLDQYVQGEYGDIRQQSYLFAAFAGTALFIACTGLFGLSIYTAARRTKEIGIRKALGASSGAILSLLTLEFAKPVIWANIIAWPIAYYAMDRWLHGFAYHINLALWMFVAAGALALVIALATVSVQSLVTALAKPVSALRYE